MLSGTQLKTRTVRKGKPAVTRGRKADGTCSSRSAGLPKTGDFVFRGLRPRCAQAFCVGRVRRAGSARVRTLPPEVRAARFCPAWPSPTAQLDHPAIA